jgi:hypothetical protein
MENCYPASVKWGGGGYRTMKANESKQTFCHGLDRLSISSH